MIGKSDPLSDYFGFVGASWLDMLPNIVSRAVKAGFTVVLLKPGTVLPACTATDMAIKRGHSCCAHLDTGLYPYDSLEPHDDHRKVRPAVTLAIKRVTERYGGAPNIAVDLRASATVLGLPQATGLLVVPPSIVAGEAVSLQEALAHCGLS